MQEKRIPPQEEWVPVPLAPVEMPPEEVAPAPTPPPEELPVLVQTDIPQAEGNVLAWEIVGIAEAYIEMGKKLSRALEILSTYAPE